MKTAADITEKYNSLKILGDNSYNYFIRYRIQENNTLYVTKEIEENRNKLQKALRDVEPKNFTSCLQNKLLIAEKKLVESRILGNPSTLSGIKKTTETLLDLSFKIKPTGFFLKAPKIVELLKAHPPVQLLKHYKMSSVEELLKKKDSECILAISRHSETAEWKKKYQLLIGSLEYSDFENRNILTYSIDTSFIKSLFDSNNHHVKPWRLSHSKEAGVILVFTQEEMSSAATPCLLQVAVFLHYVYEVTYASLFFEKKFKESEAPESYVADLIRGNRPTFPFLQDRNVYTETLYWHLALETLIEKWCPEDLKIFKFTDMLTIFNSGQHQSLNMVDILWDMNLPSDSDKYFNSSRTKYTYHVAQSVWTHIIYSSSTLTKKNIDTLLIDTLHRDDHYITERILKD